MGLSQFEEIFPILGQYTYVEGDGTAAKTIGTDMLGGPYRLDHVVLSTNSAVDLLLHVYFDINGPVIADNAELFAVAIPAGSGNGTNPPVDLIAALPGSLADGLLLTPGIRLKGWLDAALATGKLLNVLWMGGQL